MHVRHAFLALSLATVIAPSGNAQSVQRLTVSANHRFLQRADGSPFFWLGDTGWLLFSRLDRAATLRYLDDRRAKGFNVIQVMVYSYTGRPFELRLGTISGASVRAWWYSPRDGSARSIGIFPNRGTRWFTPPGRPAEGHDWVLVLDDMSRGYARPGVPGPRVEGLRTSHPVGAAPGVSIPPPDANPAPDVEGGR